MTNRRVAIIEDDQALAAGLREVFALFEYEVLLITHGTGAFEQLRQHRPEVVILDLLLPGVSGVEILQAIRADIQLAQVKVLVVTANPPAGQLAEALADKVLIKPVDIEEMMALVASSSGS